MGVRFLQAFEQLILVGALPPVATFAYRNKPVIKSPANCELFGMAAVDYDLAEAHSRNASADMVSGFRTAVMAIYYYQAARGACAIPGAGGLEEQP
jgi:hypothetical protein